MSWNPNQQSNCQNCHGLRINAEALCKLVGVIESLQSMVNSIQPLLSSLQPLISSTQPAINDAELVIGNIQPIIEDVQQSPSSPDPAFMDSGDGIGSDTADTDDGSKSTTRTCPHPKCAQNTHVYAQESSLIRHFSTHIECNEACLFCGRSAKTIYKYLAHFGSCTKKENNSILSTALIKKSELSKRSRDELRRMSKESVRSSKINVDARGGGGKRKASDLGQRQPVGPSPELSGSVGAGTTEESTYLFRGIPPWNGDRHTFRNSQLSNDFAKNDKPFQQWYPRASLLTDYTVDWNDEDDTRDQYMNASEQIPFLFDSTNMFSKSVAVNEECDRGPTKDCDTGLMGLC